MDKRPLILDIDFTLIHLESAPNAIEVPGRTRSAFLSGETVKILGELQACFDVVLASARSWDGARWVWQGLEEGGVRVVGLVLEDGALWGQANALQANALQAWQARDWVALRRKIEALKQQNWPLWEWQNDFQACLVARCDDRESAAALMEIWRKHVAPADKIRFYRDGRKLYLLPQSADKWSALQRWLGARAARSAGVGDGANDLCWLCEIAHPATFGEAAAPLIDCVQARGGFVSTQRGHAGIAEILRHFAMLPKSCDSPQIATDYTRNL